MRSSSQPEPAPKGAATSTVNPLAVILCMLVVVTEGYTVVAFGAAIPLLLTDPALTLDPATVGTIGSISYVGVLIGALASGAAGDRFGRRRMLILFYSIFILGAILSGLAGSVWVLVLARVLVGLGAGGSTTSALAVARDNAPARRAALVITVTMAGIPLGGALAALVGIWVLPTLGWRPMFLIGAAAAAVVLLIVVLTRLIPDRSADPDGQAAAGGAPPQSSIAELFRHGRALTTVLIALVAIPNMVAWFGLNTWITEAMSRLGYPLTMALAFGLTLSGGAVAGSFVAAALADRFGHGRVAAGTSTLLAVGLLGVILPVQSTAFALVCVALMGAGGHSTINLINAAASNFYPAEMRGTAVGWSNGTAQLGSFIGPTLGGAVFASGGGPQLVFIAFAVPALISAVMALALARRTSSLQRQERAADPEAVG